MKKCPNCQNTYEDSLKFCQKDGTPLVAVAEDKPEENPYQTVVAKREDVDLPPVESKPEPKPEPEPEEELDPYATMVAGSRIPAPSEDDVLEVPDSPVDPMATMVVSGQTSGNIEIEVPEEEEQAAEPSIGEPVERVEPVADAGQEVFEPEPAEPSEPAVQEEPAAPEAPAPEVREDTPAAPIPSPFEESMPPGFQPPATPPFETPESPVEPVVASEPEEPVMQQAAPEPEALPTDFEDVEEAVIEPPVQESAAVPVPTFGQDIESAEPASPETTGEGANQTLSYVALGLGILSLICCTWLIPGVIAIIVGFIARNKALSDPENYGGAKYAMIGMVLGGISIVLGIVVVIAYLLLGGMGSLL